MTDIAIYKKRIMMPKDPIVIQSEKGTESFRFVIEEPSELLQSLTYYLKFRNSKREYSYLALTKSTGTVSLKTYLYLAWSPNAEFTSVTGSVDIQVVGSKTEVVEGTSTEFVWETKQVSVWVHEDISRNADGIVGGATPEIIMAAINECRAIRDQILAIDPVPEAPNDNKSYVRKNKSWVEEQGGGGGTSDYSALTNKPQVNGVTLNGNKTSADLGLAASTDIPTVNNSTIIITQGGAEKGRFNLNDAEGRTIALAGGGGTYTEGTGIDIANNTISVENDVARNVSTGIGSFVEHRCSASQDRTFGNATAYGVDARANTAATSMGKGANSASAGIAVGYTATAAANATSVGYNANAYQNGTALGYNALATNNYGTALGRSAESHGNYGIAVGFQATLGTNSSEIAIGKDSKAQGLCSVAIGSAYEYGNNGAEATQSNSIAIGAGAKADAYNAIQIGAGTNSNSNTFQITNFPILTSNGKFYEQRMPYGLQYATELPFSLYSANENQSYGMLYTGATNAVYTNKTAYFSKALWGNSRAWCSWVNGDFVSDENQDRIMVNQATFYDKMKDWGYSGGGNSSQCVYFYYDADSEEWRAQLNDDTIEDHSCGQELTDIDLADFGITTVGITLPTSGEEEIFDIDYYAPFYFDNYDYDGDAFTIDYQVFIEQMEDGDWGFDCIEVEGEYYPNISDEGSTIRFEYDSSGPGTWKEYLDEEYCGYEWETPQMASTFGITIEEGEEESVDHIEITLYPSTRRYWKAEASSYYTKPATGIPKTDLASDVQTSLGKADTALQGHQAIKRINGQPMTGSGDLNIAEVVTTAPTSAASIIGIHIAILSSAPATEYANWIYLIRE